MKSFAKVSLLFALIVLGRYLQPAASTTTLATRAASSTLALPLALTRYIAPASPTPVLHYQPSQPAQGYFL